MAFGFVNLMMLLGLSALVLPPLIHLLNRRRFDVVDWGAMQFLQVGETVRRRILIEDLLLMALRMSILGLFVFGLAAPFAEHPALAGLVPHAHRDVVLILDGSYSMGYSDGHHPTPFEQARNWMLDFVQRLAPGDRVALMQANAAPTMPGWIEDLGEADRTITALHMPRGKSDWPRAVEEAWRFLREKDARGSEIVLVRDDQLFGWADAATLQHWEKLGTKMSEPDWRPALRVVNVGPKITSEPDNVGVAPLSTIRPVAWPGQPVTFRTSLHVSGQPGRPARLRLEVDGQSANDVALPEGPLSRGQVPITFSHRFRQAGSHLVSLIVDWDKSKRDCLPGDDRQDLAVELLQELPVLLVDGANELSSRSATYFIDKALAQGPGAEQSAGVRSRVILAKDFRPEVLTQKTRPRVLVLADVPSISSEQEAAIGRFLAEGGGLLVVVGERVNGAAYNDRLYRGGEGWLPALLEGTSGSTAQPAGLEVRRFGHPSLELFREETNSSLGQARFPRWWKVAMSPLGKVSLWATLTTGDPWLIGRDVGNGRVLLCTTTLDRSGQSDFPSVWEYPVLVHELIYHLAGARSGDNNLPPGQPLRYHPQGDFPLDLPTWGTLRRPDSELQSFLVKEWPWVYEGTFEAGAYRLHVGDQPAIYFAVQSDRRESDLLSCTAEDRRKVSERIPLEYLGADEITASGSAASDPRLDIWWLFFLAVIFLLCGEVWFTRRLALARGPA